MPRRTNPFQQVAARIQAALHAGVATVRESVEIDNYASQTKTETDIYIQFEAGGQLYRTAVECRDQRRPGGVGWIGELKSKREACRLDKIVAVHSRGFSKPALTMAAAYGIPTITLERIAETDWPAVLAPPGRILFQYSHVSVGPEFVGYPRPTDPAFITTGVRIGPETLTMDRFREAIRSAASDYLLRATTPTQMDPPPPIDKEFGGVIQFAPGHAALLSAAGESPLSAVQFQVKGKAGWARLEPEQYLRFGSSVVQDSKATVLDRAVTATVVKEENGTMRLALTMSDAQLGELKTGVPPAPLFAVVELSPVEQPAGT